MSLQLKTKIVLGGILVCFVGVPAFCEEAQIITRPLTPNTGRQATVDENGSMNSGGSNTGSSGSSGSNSNSSTNSGNAGGSGNTVNPGSYTPPTIGGSASGAAGAGGGVNVPITHP